MTIKNEEDMYNVLMKLSRGLHELESQGIDLPNAIESSWEELTEWLETR